MLTNALGEIEVLGLTAAIEAADVAVKTADVRLIGYELANGAGMVTVKIEGQVSAVQSAVAAARTAASQLSRVFATQVIPRPSAQLGDIVLTSATVGLGVPAPADRPAGRATGERATVEPAPGTAARKQDRPGQVAEDRGAGATAEETGTALGEEPQATDEADGPRRAGSRTSRGKTSAGDTEPQAEKE